MKMRIKSLTQYSTFLFVSIGCGLVYGWPEQEYEGPEYEEPEQQVYEHPRHTGPMPDMQRGNRQNPRQLSETRAQPQNTEFEGQNSLLAEQLRTPQENNALKEGKKKSEPDLENDQGNQERLNELKASLEAVKGDLETVKGNIVQQKGVYEEQMAALRKDIDDLKAEYEKLKTDLGWLKGQKAERDERIRTITLIAVSCALLLVLIFGIFKRMNRARAMYKQSQDDKNAQAEEELRCPYCGWKHKVTDEVCKNCHTRF